jgi:hypothetical protein
LTTDPVIPSGPISYRGGTIDEGGLYARGTEVECLLEIPRGRWVPAFYLGLFHDPSPTSVLPVHAVQLPVGRIATTVSLRLPGEG